MLPSREKAHGNDRAVLFDNGFCTPDVTVVRKMSRACEILRSPRETNFAISLGRARSNSLLALLIKVTTNDGHNLFISHLV